MDFTSERNELIKWIEGISDASILEQIKWLKENHNSGDWWAELSPSEEASIKRGQQDVDSGNVKPHSEVRKSYERWL